MESYHSFNNAEWRKTKDGVFELDKDYYLKRGGILNDSFHYQKMVEKN